MNTPKRKRQPTAEMMREQLRLAADEIIRLKSLNFEAFAMLRGDYDDVLLANLQQPSWWRRIFRGSK